MRHSCGKLIRGPLLWDTLVRQSCGTLLWRTLVGHCCGKILRDTLVGHSCGKLWLDAFGGHSWTFLWDTLEGCETLLQDTVAFYISLFLSFSSLSSSFITSSDTLSHTHTHTHAHAHTRTNTHAHHVTTHTHTSQHNRLMYLLFSLLIFISLLLRFPCDVQTQLKFAMTCDPDSWFQYCRFLEKKYCREPANNPHQFRIVPKN